MTDKITPEEQFDFWLGDWTVTWDDNQHGTNQVSKILDGRVIQEKLVAALVRPDDGWSQK